MTRRLAALVALLAVVVTPLGALWCAYTCATDDDEAAPALVTPETAATALADTVARGTTLTAHDECAADHTNRALRAVVEERVGTRVDGVWRSAGPVPVACTRGPAALPRRRPGAPGSPPGLRAATVLPRLIRLVT